MRKIALLVLIISMAACGSKEGSHQYNEVFVTPLFEDSVSIRAIEFLDVQTLAFAGSKGMYGTLDANSGQIRSAIMEFEGNIPEFRAVGHTTNDFFMLSVGSPALLYKTGDQGAMELVYQEEGEGVFYDSMKFWNDLEGIAIGDSMNGCLSIIITRDGGKQWQKLPCSVLPKSPKGEGAFAASNTNVDLVGDNVWIGTTAGNIYHSSDKGRTWNVISTPIISNQPTEGIYSLDFFDDRIGYAIGGDYSNPNLKKANKMFTEDGGRTWKLKANGMEPGYKSCVQFVPGSGGMDLVAVGFTGISYSKDQGSTWSQLSEEGFYTLRFLNDSVAYAAGRDRIAKLVFR
ncbi:WD40/YVTN/BNR-like repeat-containing protein [Flagellimonas allohymeniacidonis]|uniref:Oxidoreductase n=1 Tax=Flagellimonas allohymeniacidonis TaxID=2517819 RepID=A0A4Q8QLN9_9FLAO|nr:oxidoreductase [Allomuricauda hymeniacidonis]TAI49186.1 oxidoreductase [Allomuricauda hymeniacidonis]